MKKLCFFLSFTSIVLFCNAQRYNSVNARFHAQSLDEYLAPYLMYQEAYEKNVEIFSNYMEKLYEQIDKEYPNYRLIKFYVNKCIEINNNNMFRGDLYSNGELYFIRGIARIYSNETNDGINDLKLSYKYGYSYAKEVLDELNAK